TTNTRLTATQVWPAPTNAAQARERAVGPKGASGRTTAGSNPDSSATAGMPRAASAPSTRRPFPRLPVKNPLSMSASTTARPTAPAALRPAEDDRDEPVGQAGLVEAFLELPAGQRRQLRRLPNDGVARRQRLGDRRGVQQERVVPRPDHPDHPERPVAHPRGG